MVENSSKSTKNDDLGRCDFLRKSEKFKNRVRNYKFLRNLLKYFKTV